MKGDCFLAVQNIGGAPEKPGRFLNPCRVFSWLCFGAALLIPLSCSRSEPKIAYGFIELVYYQGSEKPEERFSFFIIPEDEDGIENIAELYLYHDWEQLRWQILPEDWVSFEQDGQTWIGSRGIAMSGGESLPRGQFRAVLVNKGGERSERLFSFDAPEEPRYPFPFIAVTEGRYRIDSNYPVNRFICYDEQGNIISTLTLNTIEGRISDLDIPAEVRAVALWAEDPVYFTSALTDVAALH
ncbi:MAG: hypothetical protein LBG10_09925 [Treponema sp.]|nr:hypothetical protein [Treponema sp.]